jgi:peptidoglycan/LPS O-acetylase OafA/YrhL
MVGWTLSYELLSSLVFVLTARLTGRQVAAVLTSACDLSLTISWLNSLPVRSYSK